MIIEVVVGSSAVILAGGKSNRMGRDKVFLPLAGKPLFEYVFEVCRGIFQEVIVVTRHPKPFSSYPLRTVRDLVKGGALGGLYTGLLCASNPYIFCVACDMPFLRPPLIRYLLSLKEGYDAVVPIAPDGLHPLTAVYSKGCVDAIEEALAKKCFKISQVLERIKVRFCNPSEIRPFDPEFLSFFNVNTETDLLRAEGILRGISPRGDLVLS